jgi:hypothetical protein
MENLGSLRVSALIASLPGGGDVEQHRRSIPAHLSGRKGMLLLAAALGIMGLLAGWTWFGAAAVLPLLYVLPCAAMMAMCMKGHGRPGNMQGKPDASSGTESSGSP